MRIHKFLFAIVAFSLLLLIGCSKGIEDEEQRIEVQKRSGNEYEKFKVVEDAKKVERVKQILTRINWQNAEVSMSRPSDYQFFFQFKNPAILAKAVLYSVWISPNNEQVEIVKGDSQYAQLTREDSARLFELLTGDNLTGLK